MIGNRPFNIDYAQFRAVGCIFDFTIPYLAYYDVEIWISSCAKNVLLVGFGSSRHNLLSGDKDEFVIANFFPRLFFRHSANCSTNGRYVLM